MSVIYLTRRTCKLSKDIGRLVVRDNNEIKVSVPAINVSGVVVSSDAQISTQVIRMLLAQGSYIVYTDWQGRFAGVTTAKRGDINNIFLQSNVYCDEAKRLHMVRYIVSVKLTNQIEVLKIYAKYRNSLMLQQAAQRLAYYYAQIEKASTIDELRGIEGICAKEYFEVFDEVINPVGFIWKGRTRRPAKDEINALLNYGYAFLEREVRVLSIGAGLDERMGLLHVNNGRKDSLIYDLMELVRQSVTDKLVLYSLCRKRIKKEDFEQHDEAYMLTGEGREKWLSIYEMWMQKDRQGRSLIKRAIKAFIQEMKDCNGGEICAI
ncbi:CRISPR-associated endonuclease Cas1 [Anaerovibrio sp. RM50]|uniref:CRISPR-associated endonuclease Cas1 n=1 Tax=Anaerovibrio sp. RM50 TaxID=1200557 RepID=UPI000484B47C|nr:CRISPR-associated endonuclease Cas1 [Anaerovibrio sp. RM50]